MRSEDPKVARARYRSVFIRGKKIFWTWLGGAFLGGVAKNAVDLAKGKSREFRIIELQVQQTLQLNCQNVTIPAGIFRQLVVGKHEARRSASDIVARTTIGTDVRPSCWAARKRP